MTRTVRNLPDLLEEYHAQDLDVLNLALHKYTDTGPTVRTLDKRNEYHDVTYHINVSSDMRIAFWKIGGSWKGPSWAWRTDTIPEELAIFLASYNPHGGPSNQLPRSSYPAGLTDFIRAVEQFDPNRTCGSSIKRNGNSCIFTVIINQLVTVPAEGVRIYSSCEECDWVNHVDLFYPFTLKRWRDAITYLDDDAKHAKHTPS